MLPLERFQGETHDQRMEAARRRIPLLTEDWTNLQEYDPGMTLLELFSWLVKVQRQTMEVVSEDSEARFLSLLGAPPLHARGARALLALDAGGTAARLPAGVKFRAGGMVFENRAPVALSGARLTELRTSGGAALAAGDLGEGHALALFGDRPGPGDWFELSFDGPLPEQVGLAFDLPLSEGVVRTPIPEGAAVYPLARLRWQCWDGAGWWDAAAEEDGTWGLLCSGLVRLRLGAPGADRLRAVLETGGYDLPPRARAVACPAVEVEQRDTLCCRETVTAGDLRAGKGALHSFLALVGRTQCYRRDGESWRPCAARVTPDWAAGMAAVAVDWPPALEDGEPELLAVSWDDDRCPPPADGAGWSGQTLDLPGPGVEYGSAALLVGAGEGFSLWPAAEDLYGCGPEDRAFRLDGTAGRIFFGDGVHGGIPPAGTENLRVAGLALTRGGASNLRPGQIGPPPEGAYAALGVRQLTEARGGRDEETHAARKRRCAGADRAGLRAVTAGDYERLALSTPGLILESVKVLPNCVKESGRVRACPGVVTVVIRGSGGADAAAGYVENVRRRLEPCRLAGTQVRVEWEEEL